MIKFFRKIRQNLLSENKFSKYLIYAIGEIILVVIGILIALSINNWNEEKKIRKAEFLILNDIREEIEANTLLLDTVIKQDELSIEANDELFRIMHDPVLFSTTSDSIFWRLFNRMTGTWTYDAELGMVNSVINSGKLEYITNNEIKIRLTSLEAKIKDAIEATDYLTELRTPLLFNQLSGNFISKTGKGWVIEKEKFWNSRFYFWTRLFKSFKSGAISEEKDLLKYLHETLAIIDAELENK